MMIHKDSSSQLTPAKTHVPFDEADIARHYEGNAVRASRLVDFIWDSAALRSRFSRKFVLLYRV